MEEQVKKAEVKNEEWKSLTKYSPAELKKLPQLVVKAELVRTQKGYDIPTIKIAVDQPKHNDKPALQVSPHFTSEQKKNLNMEALVRRIMISRGISFDEQKINVASYKSCPARIIKGISINENNEEWDHIKVEVLVTPDKVLQSYLNKDEKVLFESMKLGYDIIEDNRRVNREDDVEDVASW